MADVKSLFSRDITRPIEEVIKVEQTDEAIIDQEIAEYIVTDRMRGQFEEILERYRETPQIPHEKIGVWVSGFFGSGKSSFSKMLGFALENRVVLGKGAATLIADRIGGTKAKTLLKIISEQTPTHAVIFDVSSHKGILPGSQTLTEITYNLFLQSLGYANDRDLAELEIMLEGEGRLEKFEAEYARMFKRNWDEDKLIKAPAFLKASRVMHKIEPEVYRTEKSWNEAVRDKKADITPELLARRCMELIARRAPGKTLLFVVDEVGQFVARDLQKIRDLQAIVESLGRLGRGKIWLVVTSQEKLNELVGGLDDKRVELARLMDRFSIQPHLEPADISEVTSKRVLAKNASAEKTLRDLFTKHRGRLAENTRLSAEIGLPDLSAEAFIDLYPLLPYQVDFIIQVVSGLRTQGGSITHVGGANRTIIKLAQQLLIHPGIKLAEKPVGVLAKIDQIYDLVSGNIPSEIRGKIDAIPREVGHPYAQAVAKAICLLQYVKSIHRTAENIAAALHGAVDSSSCLHDVKGALDALEKALQVKKGDDGYRIPSPEEDDWERTRMSFAPKASEAAQIERDAIGNLWKPQPSYSLYGVKTFKAGLMFNGRLQGDEGNIAVHLTLAEDASACKSQLADFRKRSQSEDKSIFWVAERTEVIDRLVAEIHRSKEILSKKGRGPLTRDVSILISDEKNRLTVTEGELKRFMKQACLSGGIFFRGNDRSPGPDAMDIGKTIEQVLAEALPEVFHRFKEAAARVDKKDLEALLVTERLKDLPPVFSKLGLLREDKGVPVFNVDSGPLAAILAKIQSRTSYGETATGKYLTEEFAKEPFGWDFDNVRLFVVSLLRAAKIEATVKGNTIDQATSLDAKNTFPHNVEFRSASFRPRTDGVDPMQIIAAAEAFKETFGRELPNISDVGPVATAIRQEVESHEEILQEVCQTLSRHSLPGVEVLQGAADQMKSIRKGKSDHVIATFLTASKDIKEAIKRAADLEKSLSDSTLRAVGSAKQALAVTWSILGQEPDLDGEYRRHEVELRDLMGRETFFRELPAIDKHTRALEEEHRARFDAAVSERAKAYASAIENLHAHPGWQQLTPEQKKAIEEPLARRANEADQGEQIPLLRAHRDACPDLEKKRVEEMMRMIDGNRIEKVSVSKYFSAGIETEDQLEEALVALREECTKLIGMGKKILVQ